MNAKKEIVNTIVGMSGRYSVYSIFKDWMEMLAISISNGTDLFRRDPWQDREDRYKTIMRKYDLEEQLLFSKLTYYLPLAYEVELSDMLGEIYMESESASKSTGQYFTPFRLCEFIARLQLESYKGGKLSLNEPSVGSGGMIIAIAKTLKDRGVNYQRVMEVECKDLDWLAVHMAYVQFTYLGIKATVIQGDTLINEKPSAYQVFHTPARRGMLI